jgi:hypothetical protein
MILDGEKEFQQDEHEEMGLNVQSL